MASDQRQCPRCKTWNLRARTNCSQCGAVMLGVAAIDIEAMVRGDSAPVEIAAPMAGDDELRQTMEALRNAGAARQATGATQAGSGCAGCLGKVLLLGVIVAGGATIVAINASESELGVKIRDVWHEVEREMRASKHRKHTPPPYVAPPPRPRPVSPAPPDPWAVAAQPTSPGPDALSAPLVAAEDDAPQPLDSRAKAIATALDRRALLLLRCVQPEAKPGEPRKVTARTTLRVHAESGGALDVEAVIEPPDAPAGALRCLRLAARGLVVPNGDAVTFVYRWPKGSER